MGASLRTDDCQRVNRASRFALLTESCDFVLQIKMSNCCKTFYRADYVPNKAKTEIFFIHPTPSSSAAVFACAAKWLRSIRVITRKPTESICAIDSISTILTRVNSLLGLADK
ncbi:MAG: hypothetical protein DMF74_14405 [Acidobacteria bacterium]|nr:MAG: hypothetical protein DMF74_14405 [Acidobacteriota bacterium]